MNMLRATWNTALWAVLIMLVAVIAPRVFSLSDATGSEQSQSTSRPSLSIPATATDWSVQGLALTPTPLSRFGTRAHWVDVQFFNRGSSDYIGDEDLQSINQREYIQSLDEAMSLDGINARVPGAIPPEYHFEQAWYEPQRMALGTCFSGPVNHQNFSRISICVVQQKGGFDGFVGHSAEVYKTFVGDTYAEYVYGGWLRVPGSTDEYKWDNRAVPSMKLRLKEGGLFIELFTIGSCQDPACPGLSELISIADSLN